MAAGDRTDRIFIGLGAALLGAYVAQACVGLELPGLRALQDHDRYKVASGCVLAFYLLHQSLMARRRVFAPISVVFWHKLLGALAPVVLYLHASRFAYGYLLLLTSTFLCTAAFGLLHRAVLRVRWLYAFWFVVHIATAASLVVLSAYHAVIALAYE